MNIKVKGQRNRQTRSYDASGRQKQALSTRRSILDAALRLFLKRGYGATTMPQIARSAGIALDTVYASVGKKPKLFRLLVETAISGVDAAVPAEEREYVRAIRAERDTVAKLRIYCSALREIQQRLAPVFRVLRAAAPMDRELARLWKEISQRRARNMRLFAEDLAATGQLRPGLTIEDVADTIWSMNSPEFYLLLVEERGWTARRFEAWLADAWTRLLVREQ